MKDRFDFDGALKELFQQDHPSLLERLTGGAKVREFLNVELPRVQQRRVDLVILLEGNTILHVEIQSANDRNIAYRMLTYYALVKQAYKRPVRQVILYVGEDRLKMPDRLEEDGNRFVYGVSDIREFDAEELMTTGNQADLALAVLAGGGKSRLSGILKKAARLKGPARNRVLAQILLLAGLRGVAGKVQWDLRNMDMVIDVTKNPVLMKWRREALQEGEAKGMSRILHDLVQAKFGPLPKWAEDRMAKSTPAQVERRAKKILTAETLEDVLGKR
jgi:hypothetical protein